MAVTSKRIIVIDFAGDVVGTEQYPATDNTSSPGAITIQTLASGFNSISVINGAKAVTILPPSGNTTSIILKGITGDTGIRIHNTDPTTIALDSSAATIGLTAGASITGVRFIWT